MSRQKEEIKAYIAKHMNNKELCESVSGSFERVICYMLKDVLDEKKFTALYNQYKRDAEAEHQVVKNTVEAFPLLLNYNLVSLQWNSNQNKIDPIYGWANRYNKDASPYLYVALIDRTFYPVLDKSIPVSINDVFKMIDDKDSNSQSLLNLLNQLPLSDLKQMYPLPPQLSVSLKWKMSVVYFMCLLGRFDLMKAFQAFPLSIYEGPQEESVKNTPLHIASFKGHFNIVAVLLFSGVPPTKNSEGRLPSDFDPKDIPPRQRSTMIRIWKSYSAGKDKFMKEFANWKVVSDDVKKDEPAPTTNTIEIASGVVTVEQLCHLLDDDNQPPLPEFQKLFLPGRFDIKKINDQSPQLKCTPFYIACRRGHFEIVQFMMTLDGIKTSGPQESFSNRGNTPLHVANWRGFTRIVAYLLYNRVPLEAQTVQGGVKPNHHTEKNHALAMEVRTNLQTIFNLNERKRYAELKQFFEEDTNNNELPADFQPLWFVSAAPNKDPGPEYGKLSHIWYYREVSANQSDKLLLMDIIKSSYLCYIYLKYRKNSTKHQFKAQIPVMPTGGLFSSIFGNRTFTWNYALHDVDFAEGIITISGKKYQLVPVVRPKTWYYSTTKGVDQGPYIPFPHTSSVLLNERLTSGRPVVRFAIMKDKGFFAKPTNCEANVNLKEVEMGNEKFKIIIEEDYMKKSYWEPDFYNPRNIEDPFLRKTLDYTKDKEELGLINAYFSLSMGPNCSIGKVTKIISKKMNEEFEKELEKAQEMFRDDIKFRSAVKYTNLLWYGPGSQNVRDIDDTGLKPNNLRIWSKGYYFSSEASFAANGAYTDQSGIKILVLAKVLTANAIYLEENTSIDHFPTEFNSIYTFKSGSWVHYVQERTAAYPTYVVEFREH